MKTRFKGYEIEIDHDVVWGFAFLIRRCDGFTIDSNDIFNIDKTSSWVTEGEVYTACVETINEDIIKQEYATLK